MAGFARLDRHAEQLLSVGSDTVRTVRKDGSVPEPDGGAPRSRRKHGGWAWLNGHQIARSDDVVDVRLD